MQLFVGLHDCTASSGESDWPSRQVLNRPRFGGRFDKHNGLVSWNVAEPDVVPQPPFFLHRPVDGIGGCVDYLRKR
jgi:hypothetical protein